MSIHKTQFQSQNSISIHRIQYFPVPITESFLKQHIPKFSIPGNDLFRMESMVTEDQTRS